MILTKLIERLKIALTISETREIARRYFSLQIFDGAMVGIGAIFGLHISGPHSFNVILRSITAIMIAMVISGITGAIISERAEQEARIKKLEQATLTVLKNTLHSKVRYPAVFFVALINGLSPVGALILVSLPYLASTHAGSSLEMGAAGSLLLCVALLLSTGAIVGRTARIGVLKTSLVTVAAGLSAALLIILVEAVF